MWFEILDALEEIYSEDLIADIMVYMFNDKLFHEKIGLWLEDHERCNKCGNRLHYYNGEKICVHCE